MKPRTFSITISGDRWKYRALDSKSFEVKHGEDASAATSNDKKVMEFDLAHLSRKTVIHELFHAHCRYLYLGSSSIAWEEFEEIVAEMLEERLDLISEQATRMLEKMQAGAKKFANQVESRLDEKQEVRQD